VYETRPEGGPEGQDNYFNAVAAFAAGPGPERTLEILKSIESRLGRTETVRWGPRVIDLDLLLYGNLVVNTPDLTLPHPRLHVRRFVLAPLSDLAPEAIHPVLGLSVEALLASLGPDLGTVRRVPGEPLSESPAGVGLPPGPR
jgi:2-amino-4-hydroxy-6-hydroxymethyldihydropteridine diphosphokinase